MGMVTMKCSALLLLVFLCGEGNAWWRRRRSSPSPVNCQVHGWANWGACSNQCGKGKQTRSRTVSVHPSHGGRGCPPTREERGCSTPVKHCVVQWAAWSTCSKSCDRGTQSKGRKILQQPQGSCNRCPGDQTRVCNTHPCPCEVSNWTAWTECTKSCDGGIRYKTRVTEKHPQAGASPCPILKMEEECKTVPCPCETSDWSRFGQCSKTCGDGSEIRTRQIIKHASTNGKQCGPLEDSRPCNLRSCPVDCAVSDWGVFSPCSKPCGEGRKTRRRTITQEEKFGGKKCPTLEENASCNAHDCKDCIISDWSKWTKCTKPCDTGSKSRSRTIVQHPDEGGVECPHLKEEDKCNVHGCPCKVSEWGNWGLCSEECGDGSRSRTRTVVRPPSPGGNACPSLSDSDPCKIKECPVHCKVGEWTEFAKCSKTCGDGKIERTRKILEEAKYGGEPCSDLIEVQHCNLQECPECQVTTWGQWSKCTKYSKEVCESNGIQKRKRKIKSGGKGAKCPTLKQQRKCTGGPCPDICKVSQWSPWSNCKAECGKNGKRYRKREVSEDNGEACPAWKESQYCVGDC